MGPGPHRPIRPVLGRAGARAAGARLRPVVLPYLCRQFHHDALRIRPSRLAAAGIADRRPVGAGAPRRCWPVDAGHRHPAAERLPARCGAGLRAERIGPRRTVAAAVWNPPPADAGHGLGCEVN